MKDQGFSAVGPSLLEGLWTELDDAVEQLLAIGAPSTAMPNKLQWHIKYLQGRAHGLAWAIAKIVNPYEPNVDAIRQRAMERREERNDDLDR